MYSSLRRKEEVSKLVSPIMGILQPQTVVASNEHYEKSSINHLLLGAVPWHRTGLGDAWPFPVVECQFPSALASCDGRQESLLISIWEPCGFSFVTQNNIFFLEINAQCLFGQVHLAHSHMEESC